MGQAFSLAERDDGIAVLTFDLPGKKVNTLGRAVLTELGAVVHSLAGRSDLRGLLFRSGKPGQFIAGADLTELGALAMATAEQAAQAIGLGLKLFGAFTLMPFPTVALIDGACMGGGTELTLAMDDRIVSSEPHTKIALPEVKIGLIPAWGGTQRLPRLVGLGAAVDMITTGEPVSADKAVKIGLAFDAVPADKLVNEGVRRIDDLQKSGVWKADRKRRSQPLGLSEDEMFFAFGVAEGAVAAKTKGQYPAPMAALKAIRDGVNKPLPEGLAAETAAASAVFGSPVAANLIGVFFGQTRLGRDTGVANAEVKPATINRAGVLGAGLMGSGIATAFARSNIPTAMVDVDDSRIAAGLKTATDVVGGRIKIGRATPEDMARMLAHLNTSTAKTIFADADLVVEAVTEDEAVKTAMFKELAQIVKPGTILASNTSTISITRMAASVPDPSKFVGMHFFSPVDRMELVEVIRGEQTSDETVATVVALAKRVRKTPIVVKDCAGFLVNRVLFPYMNEALQLLAEGVPMDDIDQAAEKFGMPMGPIALQDQVGLDVAAFAGKVLAKAYPDRAVPSPIVMELVKAGRLGKKSGAGFRSFAGKGGKAASDPAFAPILEQHRKVGGTSEMSREEITDRLFLPMLLEATRVLEEGIVRQASDVDMGLILGIGFPPFRGGILRWCDVEGAQNVLGRLEKYRDLGKRFEPTQILIDHAKNDELFYPMPKIGG
jgi:3-hydroxyacyl-CoA dehydrogenase / enoyl-CoA hydratase / 3-hydroxybutyryl-CoA epimerase / enoyl-CoA isomerase